MSHGNDAGMTHRVNAVSPWRHGAAERYEVLINFRKYKLGTKIELRNLSNKNNIDFSNTGKVMQFEVVADSGPKDTYVIPKTLDLGPQPFANRGAIEVNNLKPEMAKARRRMRVERKHGIWTINGETWLDVEESGFQRVLGNPAPYDVEIWDLVNESGGWFHPVHIHLIDGQIIGRNSTVYRFRVRAVNEVGAGTYSTTSAAVKPMGTPGMPPSVTAARGAIGGPLTVTVRWTAPANGGSPIVAYHVIRQQLNARGHAVGTPVTATFSARTFSTTFTAPRTVAPDTRFRFLVQAVNEVGPGAGRSVIGSVR
jgi:Fibronectin type III domain